jgi:hypothetical protein
MATTKKTTKTVTVEMTVDKDTKNTRKYEADVEGAPVTTLYVQKGAFTNMPDTITVTITAG